MNGRTASYGILAGSILSSESSAPKPLSEYDARTRAIKSKVHTKVWAVIDRLKKKTNPAEFEATFVTDGRANIKLKLTAINPKVRAKLEQLGFVFTVGKDRTVSGTIAIEKLAELALLNEVTLVLPAS